MKNKYRSKPAKNTKNLGLVGWLTSTFLIFLLLYGLLGFVIGEFNPENWEESLRLAYCLVAVTLNVVLSFFF